jgi:hypothetical protein
MDLGNECNLMAHFESEDYKVSFDLPDNPKARQVLAYDSAVIEYRDEPALVALWECARTVVSNWVCEYIPSIDTPLDDLEGLGAAQSIEWAGTQVSLWRVSLNAVPKN